MYIYIYIYIHLVNYEIALPSRMIQAEVQKLDRNHSGF